MRYEFKLSNRKRIESILLMCAIVTMGIVLVLPSSAPEVKAVDHFLTGAEQEDGDPQFDNDGFPGIKNNLVIWHGNVDHIISNSYTVEDFMTLIIPPLNYAGDRMSQNEITFNVTGGGNRMNVYGTLITQSDGDPNTKTAFFGLEFVPMQWDGIYLYPTSESVFQDVSLDGSAAGIYFQPGAKLTDPGINQVIIHNTYGYGIRMDGARGFTNLNQVDIFDESETANLLTVSDGAVNITNSKFYYHGFNRPMAQFTNAEVNMVNTAFTGSPSKEGNLLLIEDGSSGNFSYCEFASGYTGFHHVRADGSTPFFDNCSFFDTNGELSVIANDYISTPAHVIIRNPDAGMKSFDNSTLNVTGSSSITLQWYMHVDVKDPADHFIPNAPVWVKDKNLNPADPPSGTTDGSGRAWWFTCTEFIKYSGFTTNYNPFNASAENNSMTGFAVPPPTMDQTKVVTVYVPWNPTPNTPPTAEVQALVGSFSGDVTIMFRLTDPDPGDDGNMTAVIQWFDGTKWYDATPASGHVNPMIDLNNNQWYQFVWDTVADLGGEYSSTISIRIIPFDRAEQGTWDMTGPFTIDNKPPEFLTPPSVVNLSNNTATIQWTVDELANATVYYGFWESYPNQMSNDSMTTFQSVTLTDLDQGRNYTFMIESADLDGNTNTSDPGVEIFSFETEIHIELHQGWNLISVPPVPSGGDSLDDVLATIAGQWDIIQWYDASDPKDPWKMNHTGKPFGNDLDTIDPGMGIWIHMLNDAILIPDQWDPTIMGPMYLGWPVQLYAGWNMIGYPAAVARDVDDPDALGDVPYEMVMTYDAVAGEWLTWDGTYGDLTQMETGYGYWVYCTSSYEWMAQYD